MLNIILLVADLIIVIVWLRIEKYHPQGSEYRYGFVDTNPERRISGFFDNCSPENMEDCSRNNPYEGLPKP